VVLAKDYPNVFNDFNGPYFGNIHYLSSTGLIYADDRTVVNPSIGTALGSFSVPFGATNINRMVPDSKLNVAEFLSPIDCIYDGIGVCYDVATYKLTDFSYVNSLTMSDIEVVNEPLNMIRWGPSGLAFNTDTGQVYLVDISTIAQPASTQGVSHKTAQPHVFLQNHGRVLTTTKMRLPANSSNQTR